jgi:hypothetical protein
MEFFQTHLPVWEQHAEAIGLDDDAVARLAAKAAAARAAFEAQRGAQAAAQAATLAYDVAMRELAADGASVILRIRTKAAMAGAGVYSLAQLPAPAQPAPIGPPGAPYGFVAQLRPDGALLLRWRCDHPRGAKGTQYGVRRSIDGGAFEHVGVVGTKQFVDATLPAGAGRVLYEVQARRSTAVGDAVPHVVNLGVTHSHPATRLAHAA